ncbi:MAG TPA: NAD-dependent DNA ligase LigA [Lacunisphaera sp.]|nr:NAD-dependent DNA ligase LigA [Lacunisphaera sp.]
MTLRETAAMVGGATGWCFLLALRLAGAESGVTNSVAEARIAGLRAEIAHHDELYFKDADPEISDADYDRLKRELAALERDFPGRAGATGVGDDRSGRFPTRAHRQPMLSLNKAYTEGEWREFYAGTARRLGREEVGFVVEPKYDGLAISLVYERGALAHAVTRGNGLEGDDVTENVRQIAMLPKQLRRDASDHTSRDMPELVELRGEVYVDDAEFGRLNALRVAAGEEPFGHPRNLAAGTLKSVDADRVGARRLSVVIFGWGAWLGTPEPPSQQAFQSRIEAWGLPSVESCVPIASADDGWRAIQALGQRRPHLGFPIDGAVVKLDEVALRTRLGQDDHAPRWAIACKFEPERAITRVKDITIQVGRTGLLTPVAELEPVVLGRTTIARATLHNRGLLARRDVRIGDFVEIEKAGDIIPSVAAVLQEQRPPGTQRYEFPPQCPACGTTVASRPGESAVRCPNARCPAQLRRRLEHFASASAVDIHGLGPATIDALVAQGLVRAPADFYRLRPQDLEGLAAIGPQESKQLLGAIAGSRRAEIWRFICGLGIPRIGAGNARKLAQVCGSLEALVKLKRNQAVPIIGPAAADALGEFLERPENRAELEALGSAVAAAAP